MKLTGQEQTFFVPIGVQFGAGGDFFEVLPVHSVLPIRRSLCLPFSVSKDELWIMEGPTSQEEPPKQLGAISVTSWASHAKDGTFVLVEIICNQDPLIEIVACVEGKPRTELAKVLTRGPSSRLEPVEIARNVDIVDVDEIDIVEIDDVFGEEEPLAGDRKEATGPLIRQRAQSVEESTQPDMEVPSELLDAGEKLDLPAASNTKRPMIETGGAFVPQDRAATPPPGDSSHGKIQQSVMIEQQSGAAWSSQVVEGDSLELELDQEVEPLGIAPLGRQSLGEGDGATRVISMSDLGILKNPKGKQMPHATIGQFDPLGSMATEASIQAVSTDQLESVGFDASNAGSLNEFVDLDDEDETIAPGSRAYSKMLELDATIAPGAGVRPPFIESHSQGQGLTHHPSQDAHSFSSSAHHQSVDIDENMGEETSFMPVQALYAAAPHLASSEPAAPLLSAAPVSAVPPSALPKEVNSSVAAPSTLEPGSEIPSEAPMHSSKMGKEKRKKSSKMGKEKRKSSLDDLASAMKNKRSRNPSNRLGVITKEAVSSQDKPVEIVPTSENTEREVSEEHLPAANRIRSIAEKARLRVEEQKAAPSTSSAMAGAETIEVALAKMEQARQLAAEARQMIEDAESVANGLDDILEKHSVLLLEETEGSALEASTRREARKILDLGRRIAEVEQNRLPSSTRKTLLRLVKELDKQLLETEGSRAAKMALQLANRIFETIRRDLRPW